MRNKFQQTRNFLNLTNLINTKTMVKIECFPPKFGNKAKMSTFTISFHHCIGDPTQCGETRI